MNTQTLRVTTYILTQYVYLEPGNGPEYYFVSERFGNQVGPYRGIVATAELAKYLFPGDNNA